MLKQVKKHKLLSLITLIALLSLFFVIPIFIIQLSYQQQIKTTIEQLPDIDVALVLGAAVWGKDRPSHALEDRLITAVELYQTGTISKLIMSGDNGQVEYNEPQVMKNFVVEQGVLAEDVVLDYAGFRTYDSCYRLLHVFEQAEVVIVTQAFHLPRAVYTCQELGIETAGLIADKRLLLDQDKNIFREMLASWLAWWQINISKPEPKFLGPKEDVFVESLEPV